MFRFSQAAIVFTLALTAGTLARADDIATRKQAALADIKAAFGGVPTFVTQLPDATVASYWQLEKDLELSETTALPPKTKALIAIAVAAQIPCEYCIAADTATAKRLGASDAEIGEAVSMAALTRYSSTVLHGLQVDLPTFKAEMGGK